MVTFVRPREIFSLIVWRIRGSSSPRSRGKLITISLCFRFTEFSSTLNFLPASTTSARPYPVMLLIADAKAYRRETFNVQCPRLVERETNIAPLKGSLASVMQACELLAAGAGCERHLRDHLRSHQRPPTQGSAAESSRCRVVRRGADGCHRCDDSRAGVPRNQLRYAGVAAGYDAHLGVSLSRAFFRIRRGTGAEFLPNSCAPSTVHHAHVGNSLRPAGERHDLPDAHTACRDGYPAREASAASVSHRARDERKHRQRGHAGGEPTKHDHRTFLAHFVFRIFALSPAGGSCWAGDQFF